MSTKQRPHWQAPATILIALVCGVILALGHHFFYQSLSGKPASNDVYDIWGSNISKQQLNIAGGTAFALLVRTLLSTSLETVFTQLFWKASRRRKLKDVTVESLDTVFDGLTNVFTLFKVWIWWRHPILWLLALITWLIPLASVVTPATLSVISLSTKQTFRQYAPIVDFKNLNYLATMPPGHYQVDYKPVQYSYAGPSLAVRSIVEYVTTESKIASITPPQPNSTWTVSFLGPAMQCFPASTAFRNTVQDNIAKGALHQPNDACTSWGLIAWTGIENAVNDSLPFKQAHNGTWELSPTSLEFNSNANGLPSATGPLEFYIVAMPNAMQVDQFGDHSVSGVCTVHDSTNPTSSDLQFMFENSTITTCQVLNSTYDATFDFVDGHQTVHVDRRDEPGPKLTPVDWVYGPADYSGPKTKFGDDDCSPLNQVGNYRGVNASCYFNETLLSTLSYQAISQAFFDRIVGSVSLARGVDSATFNTSVTSTVLTNTGELQFLTQPVLGASHRTAGSLQAAALTENKTLYDGLVNNVTSSTGSLQESLEGLFKQCVLSMASLPILQPNETSAFAPPPPQVTTKTFQNVYAYSAIKLWIAYGIAILFALVFAVVGLCVIFMTRSSYSLSFSTILRTARGAELSTAIKFEDLDGKDPLPSYLSNATIRFPNGVNAYKPVPVTPNHHPPLPPPPPRPPPPPPASASLQAQQPQQAPSVNPAGLSPAQQPASSQSMHLAGSQQHSAYEQQNPSLGQVPRRSEQIQQPQRASHVQQASAAPAPPEAPNVAASMNGPPSFTL